MRRFFFAAFRNHTQLMNIIILWSKVWKFYCKLLLITCFLLLIPAYMNIWRIQDCDAYYKTRTELHKNRSKALIHLKVADNIEMVHWFFFKRTTKKRQNFSNYWKSCNIASTPLLPPCKFCMSIYVMIWWFKVEPPMRLWTAPSSERSRNHWLMFHVGQRALSTRSPHDGKNMIYVQ